MLGYILRYFVSILQIGNQKDESRHPDHPAYARTRLERNSREAYICMHARMSAVYCSSIIYKLTRRCATC